MKIENLKLKINSRGEIATVLTLISVGLMLAGILAGRKLVSVGPQTNSKAVEPRNVSALASCNLSNLVPDVGDCGPCIIARSPGTKQFFIDNGFGSCADNQMASHWCNGGVGPTGAADCKQNFLDPCLAENVCTGNPIPVPSATGTGTGGGTPGPSPTGVSGSGVTPSPGGGGTPPASGAKPGGYLIVNGGGTIITSEAFNPIPTGIYVDLPNWPSSTRPDPTSYGFLPFPTSYILVYNSGATSYRYDLPDRKDHPLVVDLGGDVSSPNDVDILNQNFNPLAKDKNYTVCYFPTPKVPCTDTCTIVPTIVKYCNSNNKVNQIDIDLTNVTPEPTAAPLVYSFTIAYADQGLIDSSHYFVELKNGADDNVSFLETTIVNPTPVDILDKSLIDNPPVHLGTATYNASKIFKSKPIPPGDTITQLAINFDAKMKHINNELPTPITDLGITCALPTPWIIKPGGSGTDLGTFKIVFDLTNSKCTINVNQVSTTFGSANVDFDNTMAKWKSGEIDATQMSSFINQLTRTPGLQVTFCDPAKGECSPTF